MGKAPFDFITTRTSHPLDRGWSWVVMLAAFGSQFIVIGYQRSFGLLFVAFQERYGYSAALLSAVNGTQSLTYSFSTMLVMNYLLKKISVRTSCLLGVCFQAAGIVACSLRSDMVSLILCQGIFFGLGHSMLYCPTVLILSQYFDQHRSIATAVATCGAGAGGIAFPYITRFLLDVFGLDGALLLLAALIFNQCVFYALFQPIVVKDNNTSPTKSTSPPAEAPNSTTYDSKLGGDNNNGTTSCDSTPYFVVRSDNEDDRNGYKERNIEANRDIYNTDTPNSGNGDKSVLFRGTKTDSSSLSHIARFGQLSSSQILQSTVGKSAMNDSIDRHKLYSSHSVIPAVPIHLNPNQSLSKRSQELLTMLGGSTNGIHSSLPAIMAPADSREIGGDGTAENQQLPPVPAGDVEAAENKTMYEVCPPVENAEDVSSLSLLGKETEGKSKAKKDCIPAVMRLPSFWMVGLYIVGGIVAAGCPAIYIPPLAKEKGLTNSQATFFLTISATTDFMGRLGTGLVLHFKLIDPCHLALIPLGMCTLFFSLTPVFNDFSSVLVLTLQYGLASSMFWTLMSLVIIDVLGLANLGPAMGFYAVIYGLTTSASFPFAGWLHDETGSYSSSFHYFGAMSFVAALALIAILLPQYRAKCRRRPA